jgi:hypothetical protein
MQPKNNMPDFMDTKPDVLYDKNKKILGQMSSKSPSKDVKKKAEPKKFLPKVSINGAPQRIR